jgi:integrase
VPNLSIRPPLAPRPNVSKQTVEQYVTAWLDSATEQSPKTLERYRGLASRQVFPHLGGIPLQKLTPEDVKRWHGVLLKEVSARTVTHAHRVLGKVLATAAINGTVARNVTALVPVPKVEAVEMKVLEASEVKALLTGLEGHTLHPVAVVAAHTGMRRGEILGLQWGDIDLEGGKLTVKRSLEETRSGGLRLKPPKTKHSRRTIELHEDAVAVLRAHKVAAMRIRLACQAGALPPDAPVFTDARGRMLSPDNLSRDWRRVCERLNLPLCRFHDLRHTHVSLLLAAGEPIVSVSRRLGHNKVSTTLDIYGHAMTGADKAAAAVIGGLLK